MHSLLQKCTFNSTRANVISFTAKIAAFLALLFIKLTNFQEHSYTEFHVKGTTNAEIREEMASTMSVFMKLKITDMFL
jgi:hypothetical protein